MTGVVANSWYTECTRNFYVTQRGEQCTEDVRRGNVPGHILGKYHATWWMSRDTQFYTTRSFASIYINIDKWVYITNAPAAQSINCQERVPSKHIESRDVATRVKKFWCYAVWSHIASSTDRWTFTLPKRFRRGFCTNFHPRCQRTTHVIRAILALGCEHQIPKESPTSYTELVL